MQFDLMVKWNEELRSEDRPGIAVGLAPREGAQGNWGLHQTRSFTFAGNRISLFALTAKHKLCGAKHLMLLDDYCYVKRRVKPAPSAYMGGVWRRRLRTRFSHLKGRADCKKGELEDDVVADAT